MLRKLAADQPAEYSPPDERQLAYLQYELRRLRSLYLIEEKPNRKTGERAGIGNMPQEGDLKELFSITPRGGEFLDLREQLKARLDTRALG